MWATTPYLVVVVAAGVEVSIEAREVAARHLDAQPVTRREMVARRQRLQRDLDDLAGFHPHEWLVVAIAIPHPLNRLVEIVGASVWIDIEDLHREIGVLCVRGYVEGRLDRSADLDPSTNGVDV